MFQQQYPLAFASHEDDEGSMYRSLTHGLPSSSPSSDDFNRLPYTTSYRASSRLSSS